MTTAKITKRSVDAAQPSSRDVFIWDAGGGSVKGFGLKVTPGGAKTYLFQYRIGGRGSPTRRMTLGSHGGALTPEQARERAKTLRAKVDQGIDPFDEQRRAATARAEQAKRERKAREDAQRLAFETYADHFIERYAKLHQPRSWPQAKRVLERDLTPHLRGRPLPTITKRDLRDLFDRLASHAPALARYAFALLRKLFRWAVGQDDLSASPMDGLTPPRAIDARDRVLSDVELASVWRAACRLGWPFGQMVRLLIATGQRIGEVTGMTWAEINRDAALWTIPASRAKNSVAHFVPLNRIALAVLDEIEAKTGAGGFVLTTTSQSPVSGVSKAKRQLDDLAAQDAMQNGMTTGIAHWRYHDLRRTLATGLQRIGTRLEVTEAVLNHISGSRAGIVGVYQRHDWADEKRTALDAWGRYVEALLSGERQPSNVITLRAS